MIGNCAGARHAGAGWRRRSPSGLGHEDEERMVKKAYNRLAMCLQLTRNLPPTGQLLARCSGVASALLASAFRGHPERGFQLLGVEFVLPTGSLGHTMAA